MGIAGEVTPAMQAWIDAHRNPNPPTPEQIDRIATVFRDALRTRKATTPDEADAS